MSIENINVLGTIYKLYKVKKENWCEEDCNGYVDYKRKEIKILTVGDELSYEEKLCLKHEIVHCFFFESGIDIESRTEIGELIVDWIAIQLVKINIAFNTAIKGDGNAEYND